MFGHHGLTFVAESEAEKLDDCLIRGVAVVDINVAPEWVFRGAHRLPVGNDERIPLLGSNTDRFRARDRGMIDVI